MLNLLAFACVFASAFACVCLRLFAFARICLRPPLLRPPLRDTVIILGISKPMVCQTYGLGAGRSFTKTTEITKTTKTTKTTQTAANKELSAGLTEITETTKMTETAGIQVCTLH